MSNKPTRADLLEVMQLVNDCSSQEWQEADGSRRAATDNSGKRMWFISDDVMQELKKTLSDAKTEDKQ